MDAFAYAEKVRLRSSQGKYLSAGDGIQSRVHQSRRMGESEVWEVKAGDGGKTSVRLRSCHGGYLTGSSHRFLTGYKVIQTNPTRADDLCEWQPLRQEIHGNYIRLRAADGSFLRANGGAPPWRNSVTHQLDHAHDDTNLLWEVEMVKEVGWEE